MLVMLSCGKNCNFLLNDSLKRLVCMHIASQDLKNAVSALARFFFLDLSFLHVFLKLFWSELPLFLHELIIDMTFQD